MATDPYEKLADFANYIGLSVEEINRRLNLCPDCLQYDGYHEPNCDNEEAQQATASGITTYMAQFVDEEDGQ